METSAENLLDIRCKYKFSDVEMTRRRFEYSIEANCRLCNDFVFAVFGDFFPVITRMRSYQQNEVGISLSPVRVKAVTS